MVSALVAGASCPGSSPGRGHGDTVLCSWARHLTPTVPLSTQEYKWVTVNCWRNLTNCGGMACDGLASRPGGVEILLAPSCYRNRRYPPAAMSKSAPRLHSFLNLTFSASACTMIWSALSITSPNVSFSRMVPLGIFRSLNSSNQWSGDKASPRTYFRSGTIF